MILLEKPERYKSPENLKILRSQPCVLCHRQPSDPAHILSRGHGGPDALFNLMPLCRTDHQLQHQLGWVTFARRNWPIFNWLLLHGWELVGGKWRHPKAVS